MLDPDDETPRGVRVVKTVSDLVALNDVLVGAQAPSAPDEEVRLTDERLLASIPRRPGGLLEVHRPHDLLVALEAAYGPLPSGLSRDVAQRWLVPPHPEGIPLLQLLLARVLEMPDLARPGAVPSLTRAIEAVVQAGAALDEPLVREAWASHGPPDAVGTAGSPGPLRDPRAAPAVLVARLLANYSPSARAGVLGATNWRTPNSAGLAELVDSLELPDPRVLGPDRLASLAVLLRPVLEAIPLSSYLETVSGRLGVELEVLLERLERGESVGNVPIDAVRLRFDWLLQVDPPMAARFERYGDAQTSAAQLAPPATGSETVEKAQEGLKQWSDFFTRRFLPNLAKWRRLGRPRDHPLGRALLAADEAFARWIACAYPKLKTLPMPPLAYREVRRRSQSGPCIVLLIDGLAYELVDVLRQEALAAGIWLSEVSPWLASVPTVTEVGMLTSVAGLPVDVAWADDAYPTEEARRRREEVLRQRVPRAIVRAVFQLDQVEEILRTPSNLYVLVWSDIDSMAHRYGDSELFADYARISLRHVFRAIARAVEVHPHLRQRKDQLRLVVSADHGWTDLLEAEPAPRLAVDGARPHHRLYEVPRRLGVDDVAALGSGWVVIAGAAYDLPEDRTYLIPTENRPITRGVVRQHGGLSQGEVFVPVALGSFVQHPYRGLAIAAINPEPLQKERKGAISLILSNPNDGVLRNVRVSCLDLDLRAEIEQVLARSSGTFGPFAVRPRISGQVEIVEVLLRYEGNLIGPQQLRLEAPVPIERTPEERMAGDYSRLDSLFDEPA